LLLQTHRLCLSSGKACEAKAHTRAVFIRRKNLRDVQTGAVVTETQRVAMKKSLALSAALLKPIKPLGPPQQSFGLQRSLTDAHCHNDQAQEDASHVGRLWRNGDEEDDTDVS
jgi:hypothetical protein